VTKIFNLLPHFLFLGAPMLLSACNLDESELNHHSSVKVDSGHQHYHEETELQKEFKRKAGPSKIFSCDLITSYGICRQYQMTTNVSVLISVDCERSGSAFKQQACPSENVIYNCPGIAYDDHDPQGLNYDNYYYDTVGQHWSPKDAQRICSSMTTDYD
jgi:hypothetical protein